MWLSFYVFVLFLLVNFSSLALTSDGVYIGVLQL